MTHFDQRNQRMETQYNAGRDINVYEHPLSLTEAQRKRNRSRMLDRVQTIWISGVLEHSLNGAAQLTLGLWEQLRTVVNPWRLVLQDFDQSGSVLPADARIDQVYDGANGEVLILGEPGAGKTMLLLELARDLLERARRDETHPIPVVFNLSSWATSRQPLSGWLVSELNTKYQVPHRLAASWIETDEVLPLLDGLDEVAAPYRAACVEAINTYRRAHGLLPMVVCCRRVDYEMLPTSVRLQLQTAVVIHPLTPQQIEAYLSCAGKQLEPVRVVLRNDPKLQELATSPLMLSVLTQAYAGKSVKDVMGVPTTRWQVLADYVEHTLHRRGSDIYYSSHQTIRWLTWLAGRLAQHSQMEFYIEQMQPNWLPEGRLRRLHSIVVRLGIGLVSGLIGCLLLALSFLQLSSLQSSLSAGSLFLDLLFLGLLFGLFVGLTSHIEGEIKPTEVIVWSWSSMWRGLVKTEFLRIALLFGLSFGLLFYLPFYLPLKHFGLLSLDNLKILLFSIISLILIYGVVIGLVGDTIGKLANKSSSSRMLDKQIIIIPQQKIQYSVRNSILVGLAGGSVVGLQVGLIAGLLRGLYQGVIAGLLFGLLFGLLHGLIYGLSSRLIRGRISESDAKLSSETLDEQNFVTPNQGTQCSARNSLLVGLVGGLVSLLLTGLLFLFLIVPSVFTDIYSSLLPALRAWLILMLFIGLPVGLLSGLFFGLTNRMETERKPVEVVIWLWMNIWKRLVSFESLRVAGIFGLIAGLFFGLNDQDLSSGILFGLIFGLIAGFIFELIGRLAGGLSSETLDKRTLITPNQGIQRSARNSIIIGLGGGLIIGLLFGLITWSFVTPNFELPFGLIGGLLFGVTLGLSNGGIACIQHIALRVFVWHAGDMPWNYTRFLDYAAERVLLRKVGGGYIFLHRLLLDYFADLETEPGSDETVESRQERLQPDTMPSVSVEPTGADEHSDVLAVPLAPTPILSDVPRLLPCGHEQRIPKARFCSICGAPVPS